MASTPANGALKQSRNLMTLSLDEKRDFFASIDHVLSDVDGVVWNLTQMIEGAGDGFNALMGTGKRVTFLSNNCVRAPAHYVESFKKCNLNVDLKDIVNPTVMLIEYLHSIQFDGLLYVLACDVVKTALREAGFKVHDGPNALLPEDFRAFMGAVYDKQPVRAVFIDWDFNMSHAKMMRAQAYLRHPDCKLIVGATDDVLSLTKDLNVLGPGLYSKIMAEHSGKPVIGLGKPGRELGEMVMKYYGLKDPSKVLMIGDMLEQDICFGVRQNFRTLAVLSGGTDLATLQHQTQPDLIPDYYCQSMKDFVQLCHEVYGAQPKL